MRSHVCPDCGQLVRGEKWAGHIIKHGRIVPDPHSRSVIEEDDHEEGAGKCVTTTTR